MVDPKKLPIDVSLRQILSVFNKCWTEIAFLDTVAIRSKLNFYPEYPVLITRSNMPSYPIYTTWSGYHTIQLKFQCLGIILLHSSWSQENAMAQTSITLQRYSHISGGSGLSYINFGKLGELWFHRVFKTTSSFVIGIVEDRSSVQPKLQSLFQKIQIECQCIVIKAEVKNCSTNLELELQKLIYSEFVSIKVRINRALTIQALETAFLPAIQTHFLNHTKLWSVFKQKEVQFGRPCITGAPSPFILLKFTELHFRHQHLLYLIINFLSHGKYGVSLIQPLRLDVFGVNARAFGNESCLSRRSTVEQIRSGSNSLFMRDVSRRDIYGTIIEPRYHAGLSVSLIPSIYSDDFNFITCDGRYQESNPYTIYLRCLDVGSWAALLISLIFVSFLGLWLVRKLNTTDSPWLLLYGIFMETPPPVSRALASARSYSFVLAPILFTGILMSNGYKGQITAVLTASLGWNGLETLDDVIQANFTILSDINLTPYMIYSMWCQNHPTGMQYLFQALLRRNLTKDRNAAKRILPQLRLPDGIKFNCTLLTGNTGHTYLGGKGLPDPVAKMLNEVQKCDKSVLILPSEHIYPWIASSKPNLTHPMYYGNARKMMQFNFGSLYSMLLLREAQFDAIYLQRNLDGLFSGGFLFYWEVLMKWVAKQKHDGREANFQREKAEPLPLNLTTNCFTIFTIFWVCSLASIVVAFHEIFWGKRLRIYPKINLCRQHLKHFKLNRKPKYETWYRTKMVWTMQLATRTVQQNLLVRKPKGKRSILEDFLGKLPIQRKLINK